MSLAVPGLAGRAARFADRRLGLLMVLPAAIVLVGLVAYPLGFNVYVSLHRVSLLNIRGAVWPLVAELNFVRALQDEFLRGSVLRTAVFTGASVGLQLVLGLAVALALNLRFAGRPVLLVMALLPMMVTPVVVGIAWRMMLNHDWGIANWLVSLAGAGPVPWLSHPVWAMVSIIAVQVWWGVSFVMLVILGGLAGLPREPYEAAEIDGATPIQAFRYLTLPLLRPVLAVVAAIRTIDALREFDVIFTLTGGGPGGATRTLALELFYTAYERGDFGLSAAQALLLVVLVVLLTVPLVRNIGR
jgi:multiple sugar transport system permease protein